MRTSFAYAVPTGLDGLLATVVLFAAVVILFVSINAQHMHPDETLVYEFTRLGITDTVTYLAEQDVHPPLWFSGFWVWRHLVGDSEFAGRMEALLLSVVTLAMIYRIGRDWFGKARYGLFALAILSVNAYFVAYALEIRPYALVMLLASVSMWLYARWYKRRTWRLAAAYAVVTAIMLYVHYFLVFLVIAQILYFLLSRPSRRLIGQGIGAGLLAFALFLPWLPSFIHQVNHLRELAQQAGNGYGLGIGTPATTQTTNLDTLIRLVNLTTNGQPLLVGLGIGLGLALLWRRKPFRLALVWALGVPVIALVLNLFAAVYTQRYVVYLTLGLSLVLGAAVASLRHRAVRSVTLAAYLALNVWLLPQWLPVRVPHRDVFREMNAASPSSYTIVQFAEGIDQFLRWEIQQYLSPDLAVMSEPTLEGVTDARSVWFVTGNWFDEDVQANFRQLERSHPLQHVIGQCNNDWCYLAQLMQAPPLAEPIRFGEALEFRGADITRDPVGQRGGLDVDARLWWTASEAITLNYSFSLRLVDSAGGLIAQTDGALNHYGQEVVETAAMEPERLYIDWRRVQFPENAPEGMYELRLVVYEPTTGERLLLEDGSDSLLLGMFSMD